jgi:hypothetical protein
MCRQVGYSRHLDAPPYHSCSMAHLNGALVIKRVSQSNKRQTKHVHKSPSYSKHEKEFRGRASWNVSASLNLGTWSGGLQQSLTTIKSRSAAPEFDQELRRVSSASMKVSVDPGRCVAGSAHLQPCRSVLEENSSFGLSARKTSACSAVCTDCLHLTCSGPAALSKAYRY